MFRKSHCTQQPELFLGARLLLKARVPSLSWSWTLPTRRSSSSQILHSPTRRPSSSGQPQSSPIGRTCRSGHSPVTWTTPKYFPAFSAPKRSRLCPSSIPSRSTSKSGIGIRQRARVWLTWPRRLDNDVELPKSSCSSWTSDSRTTIGWCFKPSWNRFPGRHGKVRTAKLLFNFKII